MNRFFQGWLLLRNRWIVFIHDLLWIPFAVLAAYWVRFNIGGIPEVFLHNALLIIVVALPVHAVSLWIFGCYRGVWRFASIPDLVRLIKSVALGALATVLIVFLTVRLQHVPRSVLLIYPVFLLFGLCGSRLLYRAARDLWMDWVNAENPRALVVGAGSAGETLIRDLMRSRLFTPVALLDDDPSKLGFEIHGVRVRGTTADLHRLIQFYGAKIVLVAMPTASHEVLARVVQSCNEAKVKCRTLPSVTELAGGRVEVSRLRQVTVADLLRREPVEMDARDISVYLRGKRVLVTGGGGSIGAELCRQIIARDPALLVVLDNSEYNLYRIDHELCSNVPPHIFNSVLGDIRDPDFIEQLFTRIKPEVVFHAAAYKHVPILEDNIIEGIRNNVFGTRIVADAAIKHSVGKFVLISTDKTVNPTNVMGATKRVAELYCQTLGRDHDTEFVTTRFGNVLASDGSVVQLFEHQIASGGPVTVTHPEITRYFMIIPEAASLILWAGAIGHSGEIFVLDMGDPVRILDLAEKMIQLSGLTPGHDIQITYIGLRPGEKMHEELFYAKEKLRGTVHPKLLLAGSVMADAQLIRDGIGQLELAIGKYDEEQAKVVLKSLVPEFNFQPGAEPLLPLKVAAALKLVKT